MQTPWRQRPAQAAAWPIVCTPRCGVRGRYPRAVVGRCGRLFANATRISSAQHSRALMWMTNRDAERAAALADF
eukprot:6213950-Pleurochrysis_carterae.AAC.1